MPFSAADLKRAINIGDVAQVNRILQERDRNGRPTVDINNIDDSYKSAFNYTLGAFSTNVPGGLAQDERFAILQALLNVRGVDGNPVINLNEANGINQTALEWLIESPDYKLSRAQIKTLVDRVINLRNQNGERVCHIEHQGWVGCLSQAIMFNDPDIVRSLVDLRNADGSYTLDINEVRERPGRRGFFTPLDVACQLDLLWGARERPNEEIIAILRSRGNARRYNELSEAERQVVIRRQRPAIFAHQHPQQVENKAEDKEVKAFNENVQNVHSPEIERTVDLAIFALRDRYQELNVTAVSNVAVALKEIKAYIEEMVEAEKAKSAAKKIYTEEDFVSIWAGYTYVTNPESAGAAKHSPSGLSMLQIIALVWAGIKDKSALPADNANLPIDYIVNNRKQALLDQMKFVATTYQGNRPSCIGGARNRLIMTLHKAHPDVAIAPTKEAANELALELAYQFERDELLKLPLKKQRNILASWHLLADKGSKNSSSAYQFHRSIRAAMAQELTKKMGGVSDQSVLDGIVDTQHYDQMTMPVIHNGLSNLITSIQSIYVPDGSIVRVQQMASILHRRLQELVVAYEKTNAESKGEIPQNISALQQKTSLLLQVKSMQDAQQKIKEIQELFAQAKLVEVLHADDKSALEINKSLKTLIQLINGTRVSVKGVVDKIKEEAEHVFDKDRAFDEDFDWLVKQHEQYKRLRHLLQSIDELSGEPVRLVELVKQQANHVVDEHRTLEEGFVWLTDQMEQYEKLRHLLQSIDELSGEPVRLVELIKQQANHVVDEDRTLEEGFVWLTGQMEQYEKLRHLLQSIDELSGEPVRLIELIKQQANHVVDESRNLETGIQWLSNRYEQFKKMKLLWSEVDLMSSQSFKSTEITQALPILTKHLKENILIKFGNTSVGAGIKLAQLRWGLTCVEEADKIYSVIQDIRIHAASFNEEISKERTAKNVAQNLCETLSSSLTLLLKKPHFTQHAAVAFINKARRELALATPQLSKYQETKKLLVNLGLALTVLGLVVLAMKAGHSYITTGRATLFYDKTPEIENMERIEAHLTKISRNVGG